MYCFEVVMALLRTVCRFFKRIRCALHTTQRVEETGSCPANSITAGIIVIGDEVLKGLVVDTNSHFISKNLTELGVKVKKISVIGDDLDVISSEVRFFSEQYTYVITTGGIGPTHDDLTYEGVAKAFGESTEAHPELVKIIKGLYQDQDISDAALKFAHIPTSAKLTYGFDEARGRRTLFPNVSVRNVYIFPGVPNLMERLFNSVYKEQFGKGCKQVHKMNLYLSEKEFLITDVLNSVVNKFPDVTFGSYPKFFHSYYDVHITMESENKEEVQEAHDTLRAALPKGSIVEYDLQPLHNAHKKIMLLAEGTNNTNILKGMRLVEECFYKYKPEEVCVYLSSTKESTAALHLVHAEVRKENIDATLRGFHIRRSRTIPEAEMFVKEMMWRYTIQCDSYEEPFETAVTRLLADRPVTKAIIWGHPPATITTEEKEEKLLKPLSEAQPLVEAINVLEGWSSPQVWDFIRALYLPYSCTTSHSRSD